MCYVKCQPRINAAERAIADLRDAQDRTEQLLREARAEIKDLKEGTCRTS